MKKLKTSTWVLIGLVVVTVALGTTMVVLKAGDFSCFGYGKHHMLSEEEWKSFRDDWEEKLEEREPGQWEKWKESRRFGFGRSHHGGRGERFSGGHHSGHWGGHLGGPLIIGLLLVGGTVLVVFAVRRRPSRRADSSLSILEEQYAEGKISEEEFKRKRNVLEQNGRED